MDLIPSQNISGVGWGAGGRDGLLIAAGTGGSGKSCVWSALPSFPSPSVPLPAPRLRQTSAPRWGALKRKSLSWTQTDTGGTGSCMFAGTLDLAKLCGLGHLTVLSAQAGGDNGLFNRLPVCSHRKLLMPHFQLVSGGKCANSSSKHLIRVPLAHSAWSLKVGILVQGMEALVFPIAWGLLRTLCPSVSQGTILLPRSGYKGSSCTGVGTVAGLAASPCIVPPWPSPLTPTSGHYRQLPVP